jgi:hypothetical protein
LNTFFSKAEAGDGSSRPQFMWYRYVEITSITSITPVVSDTPSAPGSKIEFELG